MELIHKKEISLKTIFLKFLVQIVLSWFLLLALYVLVLNFLIATEVILPANTVENTVNTWAAEFDSTGTFLPNDLPTGADYACFSSDGDFQWTNLSDESLETATQLAASENTTDKVSTYRRTYLKVSTDSQILILSYQIRATFASAALRQIFPSAEPFLLMLLLLLFFSDLIFFIFRYAKKLERELLILQDAAEQIRMKNLDFENGHTRILDFNRVLDSLLLLRDELKDSLEEQWNLEQQRKSQISALAHDIKTPLTIVRGNAELLQESDLDEEQQEYNEFILENTKQIQGYVTQILEVSRSQAATSDDTLCPLDVLLSQIEKTAKSLCQEKNLVFSLGAEHLPESIFFSEDLLKRALTNLIDNAVQYSSTGGTVTLKVGQDDVTGNGTNLYFSVLDEGCGFSKEALSHATDEFYRADESRGDKNHFGLGLAIAKQIATDLGGTLTLANRENGGAMVTIRIPVK